jgi:hypothetical protein
LTDISIPPGMKHWELPTEEGTLDFTGRLIHAVDNDRGDRPRWAELRLYKILSDEGSEMWLLYTIGHTMVYHRENSECNRGIAVRAAEFWSRAEDPEGLEPCVRCAPPDWRLDQEAVFDLEVTWYTYTPCATAEKVIEALRKPPSCARCGHKPHETYACWCRCEDYAEGLRPLSAPGKRLIEQVRLLDPEIAKASARRVRL